MKLSALSALLQDNGYLAQIIGDKVLVSLATRLVSSNEILKVLMQEELDEYYSVVYSYSYIGVFISNV